MVQKTVILAAASALLSMGSLAFAADTWQYEEYAAAKLWSLGSPDRWEVSHQGIQTAVADGQKFAANGGNPPYYIFKLDGTPTFQYQKYVYHSGYQSEIVSCKSGSWGDNNVKYEEGPEFIKKYPKEAWTLCLVGADGGHGGGSSWYLFFANIKKESGNGGGNEICKTRCLRGNFQGGGWAEASNAPPCWKKENGYYSCYDYINGACPWPNETTDCKKSGPSPSPPPSTSTPPPTTTAPPSGSPTPPSDYCKTPCLKGNWQGAGWANPPSAPPCWKKENGYFSCFEYVNGKCPAWDGIYVCKW